MKVKIFGSRGSITYSGKPYKEYGGNSSCTVLDIDGSIVILDCGTGLLQFYEDYKDRLTPESKIDILLSHLHLDHIIGFSMFPPILSPDTGIRIFTRSRTDEPLVSQVFGIYKPPYWPIDIADVTKAKVMEIADEKPFSLGNGITVTPLFLELHNNASVFRVNAEKSVVYLLDYEIQENMDKQNRLIDLCKNTDLVILDTAYLPEDYPQKRGWGHSTYEDGFALAEASGCKKMVFSHISQIYTDKALQAVQDKLDASRFSIAYDGMVIDL